MNRRGFFFAASTLAGLPLAGRPRAGDLDLSLETEIRKFFSVPQHAIDVGLQYLRTHPKKADRRALIDDLIGPGGTSVASSSLAALVAHWQERDFARGAVVVIDGWVLGRTEVSLCALLYLVQRT